MDPIRDLEIIANELRLKDIAMVEKLLDPLKKEVRRERMGGGVRAWKGRGAPAAGGAESSGLKPRHGIVADSIEGRGAEQPNRNGPRKVEVSFAKAVKTRGRGQ